MIVTRCVNVNQAKNALNFNVLLMIACALGISKALQNSGAAQQLADMIINASKGLGPVGVLGGIYVLTILLTAVITNNAAAALVFPIALSASQQLGVDPRPFFITVAIAASTSFSTPISYQTNLIVQGAGGYRFSDYVKIGVPLSVIFMFIATALIPVFWPF